MKKTITLLLALLILWLLVTGMQAWDRESRVNNINKGMTRDEVEQLLGTATPDVENASDIRTEFEHCGRPRKHFWYMANPSLWYGRFEDNLLIAFVDDRICDFERSGL